MINLVMRRERVVHTSYRNAALRYAISKLRQLGYQTAATALEALTLKLTSNVRRRMFGQGTSIIIPLRSTEQAKAAVHRAALLYGAQKLKKLGYDGAAYALEQLALAQRVAVETRRAAREEITKRKHVYEIDDDTQVVDIDSQLISSQFVDENTESNDTVVAEVDKHFIDYELVSNNEITDVDVEIQLLNY
jgi:hypothetical protein